MNKKEPDLLQFKTEEIRDFFEHIKRNPGTNEKIGDYFTNFIFQQFAQIKGENKQPFILLYQKILKNDQNDYEELRKMISSKIDEIQQPKLHFFLLKLFSIMINYLFYNIKILQFNSYDLHQIDSSTFLELYADDENRFYYQKTYNKIDEELINQEVEIYHTDFSNEYPSFIVHSNDELDRNKITFPYFPFQTLRSFLNLVQNKETNIIFTPIDKFVIIKEICIGLEQLHEHSIYHQNINSSCMMITNTKDSYISTFAYDSKNEQNLSKSHPSFYYRHPDLIGKPTSLLIKKALGKEEKERYTKHDIYSLGILMYEIITTTSPNKLFDKISRQDKTNIMSTNYKSFLFSKYGNEKEDFDSKYEIEGIRKIIEKCMDTTNTYSSMKEIISDLDKLPIHQNNEHKDEIDYRIKNARSSNEYECTLSDLVINYYLGNENSSELISNSIDEYEISDRNDEYMISKITNLINLQSLNFDHMRSLLNDPNELQLYFKLNNNGISYTKFYDSLFSYLKIYTDKQPLIDSYKNFIMMTRKNNKVLDLFSYCINLLIDQKKIQTIFNQNHESKSNQTNKNQIYYLKNLPNNGNFNSSFQFSVDEKFNFYYQKIYNKIDEELMEQELINQEVEIYHTDFTNEYPSFIVHSNDELDENKITFPYFPFQTLRSFLNLVQDKEMNIIFTPIDKFVIIKEICIGLEQLHEHSIYHQNLSSSCMMITNTKDSYISNFAYNFKYDQVSSKIHSVFYYRHPDLIKEPKSLSVNSKLNESEKEPNTKHDIYSFGVLMHEIITTISPNNLFDNISRQERINILSNNYKEFLFSKYDKEKVDFDSKYGIEGFRKIIEKCMDIKNTYSSMKEILIDLDKLPIYQTNEHKDEIDYRITHVTNINEYKCSLSDLVTNYYLGNKNTQTLIATLVNQGKTQMDNIMDIFINDEMKLLFQNPNKLQQFLSDNCDEEDFIYFYNILLSFVEKQNTIQFENDLNYLNIQDEITEVIDHSLKNKQGFLVFNLFTTVLKKIIDQNKIQKKLASINQYEDTQGNKNPNQFYNLKDLPNNGDFNSAFKFSVDEKCNFYYQKTYNKIDEELMNQEVEIYHTDFSNEYPSFIVHSNDELDRNKITFPYFPFQTLRSFLNLVQNKEMNIIFTPIDKFVIIKEICIGLKQLHEHSIYHQNLNSSYIVINNDKDSYISNFAFDLKLEQHQTKLVPSFYYRHPDLIKTPRSLTMDENLDESTKEPYKKHDIYSFGVLIYEIIATSGIDDLFGNKTRQDRINILSDNYKNFLFSKYDEEQIDFDSKYEIEGIRKIIEKCMDTTNTYSSMKEILIDLDRLPIHQNNEHKGEIDYRIKNAINISTYECTLSDLVINYYLGNEISKTLIKTLSKCNRINATQEEIDNLNNEEEDIITRLLDFFNFKNNSMKIEGIPIIYEEVFNSVISSDLIESVVQDYSQFNLNQLRLMSLSIFVNCSDNSFSMINSNQVKFPVLATADNFMSHLIPITSFDKFINKFKRTEMIPIYSFFIAKEISIIHSYGLYHGEISPKSIGIYYNTKTDTFLPLIIPFYFFFKNIQNKPTNNEQFLYEDRTTFQRKDVKQFLKIIKRIDETELIPDDIYENETINSIILQLYSSIISNENQNIQSIFKQNYENYQYSSFGLTFKDFNEIFNSIDKASETYQIMVYFLINHNEESYFDVVNTLTNIYNTFYVEKFNLKSTITEDMNKELKVETMLYDIKELNDSLYIKYKKNENKIDEDIAIELTEDNTMIIKKPYKIHVNNKKDIKGVIDNKILIEESFYRFKMREFKPKRQNLDKKQVFRCIDLYVDLQYKSFEFLFRRYIRCLHPKINYKVSVRFVQSENKNITLNDVINIGNRFGYRGTNINGNIVFEIKR